jgi:hypothetical protein
MTEFAWLNLHLKERPKFQSLFDLEEEFCVIVAKRPAQIDPSVRGGLNRQWLTSRFERRRFWIPEGSKKSARRDPRAQRKCVAMQVVQDRLRFTYGDNIEGGSAAPSGPMMKRTGGDLFET